MRRNMLAIQIMYNQVVKEVTELEDILPHLFIGKNKKNKDEEENKQGEDATTKD